jgi:hypothetical protein
MSPFTSEVISTGLLSAPSSDRGMGYRVPSDRPMCSGVRTWHGYFYARYEKTAVGSDDLGGVYMPCQEIWLVKQR